MERCLGCGCRLNGGTHAPDCDVARAQEFARHVRGFIKDAYCNAPVFLAPIPEGIRVNCGDLHRVKEMTPKAMRGFALRLLEMAEGRE